MDLQVLKDLEDLQESQIHFLKKPTNFVNQKQFPWYYMPAFDKWYNIEVVSILKEYVSWNITLHRISQGYEYNKRIKLLSLCASCYSAIQQCLQPPESLANFQWIVSVPKELQGLNWLEELLITQSHFVGRVIRPQDRKALLFFALQGHTILLPQDTTCLLNILLIFPASLVDGIRVIWEKSALKW